MSSRLAERFGLDELASAALENIKGKLTNNRSGYEIAGSFRDPIIHFFLACRH